MMKDPPGPIRGLGDALGEPGLGLLVVRVGEGRDVGVVGDVVRREGDGDADGEASGEADRDGDGEACCCDLDGWAVLSGVAVPHAVAASSTRQGRSSRAVRTGPPGA